MSCGYQGYEFGAGTYPDSVCIDGRLHDADHCDNDGNLYANDEDVPCPMCRREDAIEWWYSRRENMSEVGDERSWDVINAEHRANAISLVDDIRANRGVAAGGEAPHG